jgi:hypothetical protein
VKSRRIWIVDGHNLIFQIPHLEELQTTNKRHDARRGLEHIFASFVEQSRERVVIIYDGNRLERNPDVVSLDNLETIYTMPPEEADDRIQYLSSQYLADGFRVRVLTSDLRTLGRGLPDEAIIVSPVDFFRSRSRPPEGADEKRIEGDFSDVEAELLRRGPKRILDEDDIVPPPPPSHLPVRPATPRAKKKVQIPAPADPKPEPGLSAEIREALRKKKERGRRKQQRRLQSKKK